tara:strand:- start:1394 stop:1843 length:450 start_codon:yes stop_codon:yes gene_type:complete
MTDNNSTYTFRLNQAAYDRVQICTDVTGTAGATDTITVYGLTEDYAHRTGGTSDEYTLTARTENRYQLTDVHGATGPFALNAANNLCLVFECHFPAIMVEYKEATGDNSIVLKCRSYSTANPQPSANRDYGDGPEMNSLHGIGDLETEY